MLLNGKYELELPDSRMEQWEKWHSGKGWEPERLDSIMSSISKDDLIFDIGSERGDFPALWATTGADVVMVEPNPLFWPEIRATWEMNHSDVPRGGFVGFCGDGFNGDRVLHMGTWPECSSGDLHDDPGFFHIYERPDIPMITIDYLAMTYGHPTAISMDIEGAELQALRGASHVLVELRPKVWVSIHPDFMLHQHNETREDLLDFMHSLGYQSELLAVDHEEHWLFQ